MPSTVTKLSGPESKPASTVELGNNEQPPPAGSMREYVETALIVGWPGSFSLLRDRLDFLIRNRLLRES